MIKKTVDRNATNSKSMKKNESLVKIVFFVLLVFLSMLIVIPFMVVIVTSLKTTGESMGSFSWSFKEGISFEAYKSVLFEQVTSGTNKSSLLTGFKNTFIIVIPAAVIGLLTSSISAYAFAKIAFPFKKQLFAILLTTMMIPSIITLTPSYLIYDYLYLTNTKFPLMVPGMFGAASCVFFMRQFYYGIPDDLIEAAKIDGSNHMGIFFKIMVPLSSSALIAQGVLGFVAGYNDFFAPVLYLHSEDQYTLQIVLNLMQGTYAMYWNNVMAGAVVALLPTIVLYFIAQRFFIEGIATSGLKM